MQTTIAAVSTGPAPGGIGIVRLSGPQARAVADRVFTGVSGRPVAHMRGYTAALGAVHTLEGEPIDQCLALVFAAPKSYTGEDVVELSCHGGLYVTRRILEEVLRAGAVPAQPGEFTRRAFLNGKLDLAQAEAVAQLIAAQGEQAARAARLGAEGALSKKIDSLADSLADLAAHLAAWADFPEEDVPILTEEETLSRLSTLRAALESLWQLSQSARVYRSGVQTVIAGSPNVGKSTLMNLLAGYDRSIVTPVPGTTRDVVEETVSLGGVPLRLSDTAGLRATDDPVEQIGVRAAQARLDTAQLTLLVLDSSRPLTAEERARLLDLPARSTLLVLNKSDLPARLDPSQLPDLPTVRLSAATGQGLEDLTAAVLSILGARDFSAPDAVLFTDRQLEQVRAAAAALSQAQSALLQGMTLDAATVCVEEALSALYALTGRLVSEEVVDRVFEQFCVGK